jgi:hypothetical protein
VVADNYDPTPSETGVGVYNDIIDGVATLAGDIGGVALGVGGDLGELLQEQMQLQMEMASINLVSNIQKTEHEGRMSVIRNIRVS